MPKLPYNTADLSSFASFTEKSWSDLDTLYGYWIPRWREVYDFVRSEHWNTLKIVDESKIPKWEEFPVVNMVGAFYADYMKQWLQSKQRFSALPDAPSEIAGAELADHVLANLWDRFVRPIKADIGAWLLTTGCANVRVYWDTNTGNMLPLAIPGPDGQLIPLNPETGEPDPSMQQPIMVDAGEIGVETVSPQLVRWPYQKAHGAMIGMLLAYDDVCAHYGDEIAKSISYQKTHAALSQDLLTVNRPGTDITPEERALIIEHYIPRSSKHPNGLWWTTTSRTCIVPPRELPAGRIPIVSFRWVPMPGHPTLGVSPLYDVRHINKLYEKPLKKALEWANQIKPLRLNPLGSGVTKEEYDNLKSGDTVSFNPGAEPRYDQLPEPPALFEKLRAEFEQLSALVGLYKFRKPPELPPGEARGSMRQPQTAIVGEEVALAIVNAADSWTDLGYILLGYVGKFYTEPRSLAMVGPDKTYQWREFVGSDLANLRATLRLNEVSLYPWNRQSIKDAVISLLGTQAGQLLFMNAEGQLDRDKISAAFEAAGLEEGFQTLDPDVLEARNELNDFRNLQEGQPPPEAKPWQNSPTHLEEKKKIVKSIPFKGWPKQAQDALLQNLSQHEQMIAQQQKAAQESMLQQEQALRGIRGQAESASAVRTALGEGLVEMLVAIVTEKEEKSKKKSDK